MESKKEATRSEGGDAGVQPVPTAETLRAEKSPPPLSEPSPAEVQYRDAGCDQYILSLEDDAAADIQAPLRLAAAATPAGGPRVVAKASPPVTEAKAALGKHLAGIGYELNASRQAIFEKLRQHMGEARFQQIFGRERTGPPSASQQEEFYSQFHDIVEANLMRSLDPQVTLDASYSLYEKCQPLLVPGARVIELGCWTGGLASFIAQRHPQCSVVGVDGARQVVEACTAHYRLPNLSFLRWNYRWGKPEELEPADVLLSSLGVVHQGFDNSKLPDPCGIRRSTEYVRQNQHAAGYFSVWRSAAQDRATLFAVFRLRPFPRFLAWIDAAQDLGWAPLLDRFWHVDLPGEGSVLPGLVFEAGSCDRVSEDAVLDRWTWFNERSHGYARLEGGAALATFRALANKTVLAKREYRPDGLLTQDEVGVICQTGYVFTHDADSKYRLLLTSHTKAKELAGLVSATGFTNPITDEATFKSTAIKLSSSSSSSNSIGGGGWASGNPFFTGSVIGGRGERNEC